MITLLRTGSFDRWLARLKDIRGKAAILHRLRAAERGHFGDCKTLGEGLMEMRVHAGPGYQVYFMHRGEFVYVLLSGGARGTQQRDIRRARGIARQLLEN